MHSYVCHSTIHNNKDIEQTLLCIHSVLAKKMWYIYTVEHYTAMKKNEILSFAATWMHLDAIILSKLMQEQTTKYHLYCHL